MRSAWFWAALVVVVAGVGYLQYSSVRDESQTYDEGVHILAGYSYLKTGDYRLNREHPPLVKLLCALPLLRLDPIFQTAWLNQDNTVLYENARQFLYANRVSAETLLLSARSVMIALTMLFLLSYGAWIRTRFGSPTALVALFLLALDPNLLAHGRYVTTDLMAAATIFFAVVAWERYLETRRMRDLLLAGAILGVALLSKFSTILLLPIFVLLYTARAWQEGDKPGGLSVDRFFFSFLAVVLIGALLIGIVYAQPLSKFPPLAQEADGASSVGHLFQLLGQSFHLRAHPYLVGLLEVLRHGEVGHSAYLLGEVSERGWLMYFPVAFAVKTPTAALLLLLVVLPLAISKLRLLRRADPFILAALITIAFYFMTSVVSRLNIGIRHLLPIYPFLYLLLAAGLFRIVMPRFHKAAQVLLVLVVALQAGECARIHPYYLAYFNLPSGGPARGSRYLVDSNLDWGQDWKRLVLWHRSHGRPPLCITFFGGGRIEYYFPHYESEVPRSRETELREKANCVAAISATVLQDVYVSPGDFAWLRARKPMGNIGYSIYLFDLRKPDINPGGTTAVSVPRPKE